MHYTTILDFWFDEVESNSWWRKDSNFDQLIRDRFENIHRAAARCELYQWRENPLGRLAEIIVLDQFSRNIYRGQASAFSWDALGLALSQEAIGLKANLSLNAAKKVFLYLPFMHSESPEIHKVAVQLFDEPGLEPNLEFEYKHKAIIDRFRRYPHRNNILGRQSTPDEFDFLKGKGSSF